MKVELELNKEMADARVALKIMRAKSNENTNA